ncbi:MAG: hypothetical protein Q9213_000625 [Squamulea squamosa]
MPLSNHNSRKSPLATHPIRSSLPQKNAGAKNTRNMFSSVIFNLQTLQSPYLIAWASAERRYRDVGDQVSLSLGSRSIPNADELDVSESQDHSHESLPAEDLVYWAWLLSRQVNQAGILCPGMIFNVRATDEERAFRISSINRSNKTTLYQTAARLSITIAPTDVRTSRASDGDAVQRQANLDATAIGGLDAQVAHLNSVIARYGPSAHLYKFKSTHRPRRGSILLHGPSGTGKSTLLRMIAAIGCWRKVYCIKDIIDSAPKGGRDAAIRKMFADAHQNQPSVIIVDNLDVIAGKSELANDSQPSSLANSLCEGLDARGGDSKVLVVAAARNLAMIDESLRYPGRFEIEIEVPVPGTHARAQILNLAYGSPRDSSDTRVLRLADLTHGYVGSDLRQLLDTIMDQASSRVQASGVDNQQHMIDNRDFEKMSFEEAIMDSDIEAALVRVQPTAMKEIFLDTPRVRWEDIGGQEELKEALREAIEWPLKYRSAMEQRGIRPEKGLLLYGPPGCSKTLVAKAVATEAKLNFIAIKGAEILKMYVGESERAVREVFQKARGAAPSIIFFDEIDSIGASRAQSQHGGPQVLTTLLNELDGIEALRGVFVLAATNRPQLLDSALLRPGRLETSLYVGLPDYQTRSEIVAIETRKMSLGPDYDAAKLAEATDGYSGAEVVKICQQASRAAYREESKIDPGQPQPISMRHFTKALEKVTKQVTPAMVRDYEAWRLRQRL